MTHLLLPLLFAVSSEILYVVFPRGCAGCGLPDEVLCARCSALFRSPLFRPMPQALIASGFVAACASYSGPVRNAILQWKDHGDVEVGKSLSSALAFLLERGMFEGIRTPHGKPVPDSVFVRSARSCDVVAVVPAPSSPASMAQRGRLHTKELAASVVETLHERGIPAELSLGLEMVGRRKKSVEVGGIKSREQRSKSGIVVRLRRFPENCHDVIIVDDICTTGSTLLGCARQLHTAGYRVLYALTLAAVPD